MVTTPLELMCGVMLTVVPELSLLTVLENTELPPDVTPDVVPADVSTGTCVPTFMVAAIPSVAMMLGEEITREWPRLSDAVSRPNSCLLPNTTAPAVN